jgi:prepilin-type processing-associated H-X9-DG protein
MNQYANSGGQDYNNDSTGNHHQAYHAAKINQIRNPSSKLLMMEEDPSTIDDGNLKAGQYPPPNANGQMFPGPANLLSIRHDSHGAIPDTTYYNASANTFSQLPNPGRRGNVGYADGSVRSTARRDLHDYKTIMPKQ